MYACGIETCRGGLKIQCPLFGVDRKWLAKGQTDANDPERTSSHGELVLELG